MAILTADQIEQLRQILRDASTAVAISTTGLEVGREEMARLAAEGYVDPDQVGDIVLDGFEYGQIMQRDPSSKDMSYLQFRRSIEREPVQLSAAEQKAVEIARTRAGQFCVGLGTRYSGEVGTQVIKLDQQLAQQQLVGIREAVSQSIAYRGTISQLKSELGRIAEDWARDWHRIAITETHLAHQQGFYEATVEEYGSESMMAKIPEPTACDACKDLYLGPDGRPIVRPASWWNDQGIANVGLKKKEWKPALGSVHPHCQCQLVRVPEGMGFNEDMDLMPLDMIEKSRKLHYRTTFAGLPISIENRRGSYRHWYDKATETHGKTFMKLPYGYIRLTEGADGDHVDCFLGPDQEAPKAYVVHQLRPKYKRLDNPNLQKRFSDGGGSDAELARDVADAVSFLEQANSLIPAEFERSRGSGGTIPSSFEGLVYRALGDSKLRSNASNGRTLAAKFDRLFEIPKTRSAMYAAMVRLAHQDKVRDLIVETVPIGVVNDFISLKSPAESLFHDYPVFKALAALVVNQVILSLSTKGSDVPGAALPPLLRHHWEVSWEYDECKVFLGFRNKKEVKDSYLSHFDSPYFFGSITTIPMDRFREQVLDGSYRSGQKIMKGQVTVIRRDGSAWEPIPHGKKGGQRRKRKGGKGYEYRYPKGLEGSRIKPQRTEKSWPMIGQRVAGAADAAYIVGEIADSDREKLLVLSLDEDSRPINVHVAHIGVLSGVEVDPRQVFKPAVMFGAKSIYMFHNHPSGESTPSEDDRALSARMKRVSEAIGVKLNDHLVVVRNDAGDLAWESADRHDSGSAQDGSPTGDIPGVEFEQKHTARGRQVISSHSAFKSIREVIESGDSPVVLFLDARNRVIATHVGDLEKKDLFRRAVAAGAAAIITGGPKEQSITTHEARALGLNLLDHIWLLDTLRAGYASFADRHMLKGQITVIRRDGSIWEPIPHGKRGGVRKKKAGGGYDYKYPKYPAEAPNRGLRVLIDRAQQDANKRAAHSSVASTSMIYLNVSGGGEKRMFAPSDPAKISGLAGRNLGIQITAHEIPKTPKGIERFAQHARREGLKLMVDSGEFPRFVAQMKIDAGKKVSETVKKRAALDFDTVMRQYGWLASAMPAGTLTVVAPDRIADGEKTAELRSKYAPKIKALMDKGVDVIVPLQARTTEGLVADYMRAADHFGDRFVIGIPMAKKPMPMEELLPFMTTLYEQGRMPKVHMLGGSEPVKMARQTSQLVAAYYLASRGVSRERVLELTKDGPTALKALSAVKTQADVLTTEADSTLYDRMMSWARERGLDPDHKDFDDTEHWLDFFDDHPEEFDMEVEDKPALFRGLANQLVQFDTTTAAKAVQYKAEHALTGEQVPVTGHHAETEKKDRYLEALEKYLQAREYQHEVHTPDRFSGLRSLAEETKAQPTAGYRTQWIHGRNGSVDSAMKRHGSLYLTDDHSFAAAYGKVHLVELNPSLKVFKTEDEDQVRAVVKKLLSDHEKDKLTPNLDGIVGEAEEGVLAEELAPDNIRGESIYDNADFQRWLTESGYGLVTFYDDTTALVLDAEHSVARHRPVREDEDVVDVDSHKFDIAKADYGGVSGAQPGKEAPVGHMSMHSKPARSPGDDPYVAQMQEEHPGNETQRKKRKKKRRSKEPESKKKRMKLTGKTLRDVEGHARGREIYHEPLLEEPVRNAERNRDFFEDEAKRRTEVGRRATKLSIRPGELR